MHFLRPQGMPYLCWGLRRSGGRMSTDSVLHERRSFMTRISTKPLPGTSIDPLYPDSDGRPMGDTDFHNFALRWLWDALQDFFAGLDFYIAVNLLMYYEEGNPKGRRDPDILVAKGVGTHKRRSFRFWEEKRKPCTLF